VVDPVFRPSQYPFAPPVYPGYLEHVDCCGAEIALDRGDSEGVFGEGGNVSPVSRPEPTKSSVGECTGS
jgi:hypothetical protein